MMLRTKTHAATTEEIQLHAWFHSSALYPQSVNVSDGWTIDGV